MSWDNRKQRRKFEKEWKIKEAWYRSLGMSEYTIAQIRMVDEELYNSERNYHTHTQSCDFDTVDQHDNETGERMISKEILEAITVNIDTSCVQSRYWWIEDLSDAELAGKIKTLPPVYIEILTMIVVDHLNEPQIATLMGTKKQNICNKITRIKKILK